MKPFSKSSFPDIPSRTNDTLPRRYRARAQADIERSYQWGVRHWGKAQANEWARQLRQACRQLSTLPSRHPITPENEEFAEAIRQMVCGRYRIIFTINGKTVHVLHVAVLLRSTVKTH